MAKKEQFPTTQLEMHSRTERTHSFAHRHGISMYVRHRQLPEGFTQHKPGKPSPFDSSEWVELMIRTKDGLGSTGICRAGMHDFKLKGLGEVCGYRSVKIT